MISTKTSSPKHLKGEGLTTPHSDFIQWAKQTIEHLEQKKFDEIDIKHLIYEIELLVEQDQRQLRTLIFELLLDLLQWQYQPDKRSQPQTDIKKPQTTWTTSITYQRDKIHQLLEESPSLRDIVPESIVRHYPIARALTADQAGVDIVALSTECPYTTEQILDEQFWPEGETN